MPVARPPVRLQAACSGARCQLSGRGKDYLWQSCGRHRLSKQAGGAIAQTCPWAHRLVLPRPRPALPQFFGC
jgi:hypothetical protein